VSSDTNVATATRMGQRRGELFRDTGVPQRNPFSDDNFSALAQAWRRAYLEASKVTAPTA
jgi:hypothetical protein